MQPGDGQPPLLQPSVPPELAVGRQGPTSHPTSPRCPTCHPHPTARHPQPLTAPRPHGATEAPLTTVGSGDDDRLAGQVGGTPAWVPGASPRGPEQHPQQQGQHGPQRVAAEARQLHGCSRGAAERPGAAGGQSPALARPHSCAPCSSLPIPRQQRTAAAGAQSRDGWQQFGPGTQGRDGQRGGRAGGSGLSAPCHTGQPRLLSHTWH